MSKTTSSSPNPLLDDDEEYLLDEVKGMRLKKKLAVLNKGKVTKEDMDKLFLPEDFND
jgi:hypothetical protein